MTTKSISITILGKIYQVKCPEHEIPSLQQAAKMLEEKMKANSETGKLLSHDRIAVITSLNLAHQIMMFEQTKQEALKSVHDRLRDLQDKIDTVLAKNAQMELVSAE